MRPAKQQSFYLRSHNSSSSHCVKCVKLNKLVFLFLCHFNGNLTAFKLLVWNVYCFFTTVVGISGSTAEVLSDFY